MEQKRPGQDTKRPGGEMHSQGGPEQRKRLGDAQAAQAGAADPVDKW